MWEKTGNLEGVQARRMQYDAQAVVEPLEAAVGVKLGVLAGHSLQELGTGSPLWAGMAASARLDCISYMPVLDESLRMSQQMSHGIRYLCTSTLMTSAINPFQDHVPCSMSFIFLLSGPSLLELRNVSLLNGTNIISSALRHAPSDLRFLGK